MRTLAIHILLAFALAGLVVGPVAMAADCLTKGPVAGNGNDWVTATPDEREE